jgi:cellobiose phosphorylase
VIMGLTENKKDLSSWVLRYGTEKLFQKALEENKQFWVKRLDGLTFKTGDPLFNGWLRWVSVQPVFRKIFGCSFLPDFDYGRGGRGWRDLWQDCLALSLFYPSEARPLLLNNFGGVRVDGSNATIIGRGPGEFIADRNNITRVWMDHGVWPYITTELYIHQTGDFSILSEERPYFRDPQLRRAKQKDASWTESYGRQLKTKSGEVYLGTVLEHMLVQHLVAFFNVGDHNMIRLEDADWNDGLDMAHHKGESVAFSALYAGNLASLVNLLEKWREEKDVHDVFVAKELLLLLDRVDGKPVDYGSPLAKQARLTEYFDAVGRELSGQKAKVSLASLMTDLAAKSEQLAGLIRRQEWTGASSSKWFNGYYDDEGRRVEGKVKGLTRMTLTGQVFPIMSGVATPEQISEVWKSARKFLKDKTLGGFRLNTDFKDIQPALGRAFSFAYGEKENGAFFNHMAVMFANALYRRGFVEQGREVFRSIFEMSVNADRSRIYPGLPEYFNGAGRGMYHYLTGSASWFVLTYLTQVCGVRGFWGDLMLAPKLTAEEFQKMGQVEVRTSFAGQRLKIVYRNPRKLAFGRYRVLAVEYDGEPLEFNNPAPAEAVLSRAMIEGWPAGPEHILIVSLG